MLKFLCSRYSDVSDRPYRMSDCVPTSQLSQKLGDLHALLENKSSSSFLITQHGCSNLSRSFIVDYKKGVLLIS